MLAIEEMEARLHPNLQIALLERLLKTVAVGIPCILETHSIYLLRRAQLAVVKGELTPEDLAIYWVERDGHAAQARRIEVLPDGTLHGWNPETFEEEQQLSRDIFEARWKV
jgi:predicted ATPase